MFQSKKGVVEESEVVGVSAQSRLVPSGLQKPQTLVLEGLYSRFKFSLDTKAAQTIAREKAKMVIHLDIFDSARRDFDADVYVGAHSLLFPTQHSHEWSSHDNGSKVVVLGVVGKPGNAGNYGIGVHGFVRKTPFRLLVKVKLLASQQPSAGHRLGQSTASNSGADLEEGFARCENCRKSLPAEKMFLLEAFYFRHNFLYKHPHCGILLRKEEMEKHVHCSKCGQAMKSDKMDRHMKIFHQPSCCECVRTLEMEKMMSHKANDCPLRSIICRFCGNTVQAGEKAVNVQDFLQGLSEHESSCGSRTNYVLGPSSFRLSSGHDWPLNDI